MMPSWARHGAVHARADPHGPAHEAPGHCSGFAVPDRIRRRPNATAGLCARPRQGAGCGSPRRLPCSTRSWSGRQRAGQGLTLPGETHAWYESTIYARVTGYVAKWNVDIGDHVHKGQVLAEIETPELDAQLVAAQAKLKATQADVQVREAEAEFARTTYARWREAPKGVVSEQEREDKKAEFDSAVARLASAQAHVALDQADVDRFAAFEKFKRVTAPYDGTIIERRIDIGNLVTAGSSSGTMPLYRMTQDDPMRVWVDVPQTAAGDLMKSGVPVVVVTNEVPSRRFEGKIVRTAQAVNSQARTFRVEIDVPNPSRALVSGMYVQAIFTLPANGLLQVPAAALIFRAAGPQVAVVGADGSVHLRSVSIARDDGGTVLAALPAWRPVRRWRST